MKLKRLFTLAALLTSSLASAVDLSDLENKYYAGVTAGVSYHSSINFYPSIVVGYHYDKSSKLELELNGDIFPVKTMGINVLANYRYYPDFNIDPVTLYVSGGLGANLTLGKWFFQEKSKSPGMYGGEDGNLVPSINPDADDVTKPDVTKPDVTKPDVTKPDVTKPDVTKPDVTKPNVTKPDVTKPNVVTNPDKGSNTINEILGYVAYKLKVGVDYEITPQIIVAGGVYIGGSVDSLISNIKDLRPVIELGIRYNF